MDKLIVNNTRRVKKCLGINTTLGEDLIKNKNATKFIDKYQNLLNSTKIEDFKKLMEKTGISITHFYITRENKVRLHSIYFNMMGSCINNPLGQKNTFNHDIAVVTYVDNIEIKKNKIFIDGKNIYDLKDDNFSLKKGNKIRWNLSTCTDYNKIEEQVKYINNLYNYNLDSKNIKQIKLDIFENLLVLYKNGNLYRNNILYDINVKYLCSIDSYTTYLIYKDNSVFYYTSEFETFFEKKYKKVICEDNYLFITLSKDNVLGITINDEFIPDTNILMSFIDVDDVLFKKDKYTLEIIKNKEIIKMPLEFNPLVVTDINYDERDLKKWEIINL